MVPDEARASRLRTLDGHSRQLKKLFNVETENSDLLGRTEENIFSPTRGQRFALQARQ